MITSVIIVANIVILYKLMVIKATSNLPQKVPSWHRIGFIYALTLKPAYSF